jgi:hypothetical protein
LIENGLKFIINTDWLETIEGNHLHEQLQWLAEKNATNYPLKELLSSVADLIRISEHHCRGIQNDRFYRSETNFMDKIIGGELTIEDVLIVPCDSEVTPDMGDITSFLMPLIRINISLISSPMDTVTEAGIAMAMA